MLNGYINSDCQVNWKKQYTASFQKYDKQKPLFGETHSKQKHCKANKKSHKYIITESQSSISVQSSLSNYKVKKHCCSRKKRQLEQQNQIQRMKVKKLNHSKEHSQLLNGQHQCSYQLYDCPLIKHYLKKIQNKMKYQGQKLKIVTKQNKQLVKENRFFNQYYGTFADSIKLNTKKIENKLKNTTKQKVLSHNIQQTDYCTFKKFNFSPRKYMHQNATSLAYEEENYYTKEQPSQITRSSNHKNHKRQMPNSVVNIKSQKKR